MASSFAAVSPAETTLPFYEARAKSDPGDFIAQNHLAMAYIQELRKTGDLTYIDRASAAAHASLKAVPATQNTGGLVSLSLAEFEGHHFREALTLSQQALGIDSQNLGALATTGDAELELGDYAEAEKIYTALTNLEVSPSIEARVSRLIELKGDNERAVQLLQDAAAEQNTEWYHIRMGEIFFRTGQFDQAQHEYEAAQKLAPGHFLVLDHLAELQAARGNYAEATNLYEQVISLIPRPDYFQALGDVYLYMGKVAEAKSWHDKALAGYLKSIAEGHTYFCHHLAGFYCDSEENPTEALRWAREDLKSRHSVYAQDALAWAYYKNGDYAQAATEMDQALSLGTKDAHLLYHASMIFSQAGQLDRGSDFLKLALTVNPRYNTFHVHR